MLPFAPVQASPQSHQASDGHGVQHRQRLWVEWLWRGEAMATAHAVTAGASQRALDALAYARRAAELGDRALAPTEPFHHGAPSANACDLYLQCCRFALQSRLLGTEPALTETALTESSLLDLWRFGEERGRLDTCPSEVAPLLTEVSDKTVMDLLALPPADQRALARRLKRLAHAVLALTDTSVSVRAVWRQRLVRWAALLCVLGVLGIGAAIAHDAYRMSRDLARGKPWSTSAGFDIGCKSPEQRCKENEHFFFHTQNESQPWFMIDLGTPQLFSGVNVKNRDDCCFNRAIPLVLEVRSTEQEAWREIARRTEVFETVWRAEFAPTSARFVRLRAARFTTLHLFEVRVLP